MKVLFVCTGNACRSPVAEALLKLFNPKIEADSAGTHAYHKIVEMAKNYVEKEQAKSYLKKFPESLSIKKIEEYDVIVAMEMKHKYEILRVCPTCESKIVVWHIDDPYVLPEESAEKILKIIKNKVHELAKSYN